MLALTLLNTLISLDWQGKWLQFMVQKGILNDLATSIQWEDDSLAKVLELIPQSLKALYVYESKMVSSNDVCKYILVLPIIEQYIY